MNVFDIVSIEFQLLQNDKPISIDFDTEVYHSETYLTFL